MPRFANRSCLAVLSVAAAACSDAEPRPANRPPALVYHQATTDEDVAIDLLVLDGASDADGDALTVAFASAGEHPTEVLGGQIVRLTPKRDFHGAIDVRYDVSDGSSRATGHVAVTVRAVNDPPVATPQTVPVTEDSSVEIALGASDAEGDALAFQIEGFPSHGTLSSFGGERMTYTPDPDYSGSDSFTFVAHDLLATSSAATVTLRVNPVNDPPRVADSSVTTDEDRAVGVTLHASDVDDPSLTFTILTGPSDGTLSGIGADRIYTPARDASGTRTIAFRVTDSGALTADATVTITIRPVNDPPTARDDVAATEVDTVLTFSATGNDIDVDGDTIGLAQVDAPAHGTAAVVDGNVVYTPDPGFTGVEVFAYTVVDGHGGSARGTAHIGVGTLPPGMPTERIARVLANAGDDDDAPAISDDGRHIAFVSLSPLVADDTNNDSDVYAYDRITRTLSRVSVAGDRTDGDGFSGHPRISSNGRYVVFDSDATNLVPGDTNAVMDVFRHDRVTGQTVRVSVASGGTEANNASSMATISDDGNLIAFSSQASNLVASDANGFSDVFVRDVAAGTTIRVSVSLTGGDGDRPSEQAVISGDGRRVAFASAAANLVADDTNQSFDAFVRDLAAGTTVRASVSSAGEQANAPCSSIWMSRDGRVVSFLSRATNLVSPPSDQNVIYVRDTVSSTTTRPTLLPAFWARLSGDGRFLAEHTTTGIFIADRVTPALIRIAGPSLSFWPVLSANGQYVVLLDEGGGTVTVMPNPLAR